VSNSLQTILFLILLFSLTACGTSTVNLTFAATRHLNQNAENVSLPVIVRVYTLTSADDFNDASFRELWHNDKAILGSTLIDREEYTVSPNHHFTINVAHDASAKYLAVVALFRRPHGSQWRVVCAMPGRLAASMHNITVILSGSAVSLK
jgi:type VI secretion system protein VasD